VPCPHFSPESGECRLLDEVSDDDESSGEIRVEEPVSREWCLSSGELYRNCPVYHRFVSELMP